MFEYQEENNSVKVPVASSGVSRPVQARTLYSTTGPPAEADHDASKELREALESVIAGAEGAGVAATERT